jgi:hypothetical protein
MFPDKTTLWIIKICGVGVALCLLYFWGRGHGIEVERKRGETALAVCTADRTTLVTALDEVNARAALAKQAEAQQQARAEKAVAGAKQDAKTYETRIADVGSELEKAKRQPTCRAQLEAELCADLH